MKKLLSLFSLLIITQLSLFSQSDLVITEINYNPVNQANVEYLEIYNNGLMPVELKGVSIPKGGRNSMEFTFPAHLLNIGEYVIISNDSVAFSAMYQLPAFEYNGAILNTGMNITLLDSVGLVLDSLTYGNDFPWVATASREGCSIELCDPNVDNSMASSWERSTTYTGQVHRGRKMYGSPGSGSVCPANPVIHMRYRENSVAESAGTVSLGVYIDRSNGSASSVKVKAINGSGDISTDIMFTSPATVNFTGTQDEMLPFFFDVINDTLVENDETVFFILENVTNGILSNDTVMVTILKDENDNPVTRKMKLIGHTDFQAAGAVRMVEVMALDNIANMSIYGIGVGNVRGTRPTGTDGVEYNFPAVAAVKDQHYFVTNDSAGFVAFFGFAPDFVHDPGGAQPTTPFDYTGDDPIELFENDRTIDIYGDLTEDGSGKVWEYTDGWAKRKDGTGPDGNIFVPNNWTFGRADAFVGFSTNNSATAPYPLPKEPNSIVGLDETINNVSVYPNPASTSITVSNFKNVQSIILVNLLGKTLDAKTNITDKVTFDLSELNSGLYFVRVTAKSGKTTVVKVIKE